MKIGIDCQSVTGNASGLGQYTRKLIEWLPKIDSQNNIELTLRRNFKIVDRIKSYSLLKNIYVIAFKLTHTDSPETRRQAIEKLTLNSQIDFVVHNDLSEIRSLGAHVFHIYDKKGLVQNRLNLIDLGENLENLVKFRREKL